MAPSPRHAALAALLVAAALMATSLPGVAAEDQSLFPYA
jgi:hypothetical protein